MRQIEEYTARQADVCREHDSIDLKLYSELGVKKGLRDENGHGVLTGLTNISSVRAFDVVDEKQIPCDGELLYGNWQERALVKSTFLKKAHICYCLESFLQRHSSKSSGKT